MGLPLMSRYSSANTLGPLSMARPDPSKIRPSMSSETPSFKLSPVNSTFVCSRSISITCSIAIAMASIQLQEGCSNLLHIDACCSFENLAYLVNRLFLRSRLRPRLRLLDVPGQLLCLLFTRWSASCSPSYQMPQEASHVPRASRTCPCLIVPSGSVKLTISLYFGNLTCSGCQHKCSIHWAVERQGRGERRTFSRMTRGPLTPPTVLYLR